MCNPRYVTIWGEARFPPYPPMPRKKIFNIIQFKFEHHYLGGSALPPLPPMPVEKFLILFLPSLNITIYIKILNICIFYNVPIWREIQG